MGDAVTSIFDMRDGQGRPYFDVPGEITDEEASVCELVERMGGQWTSGAQRANVTRDVEQAVAAFFESVRSQKGEELAAVLTLRVIARAADYRPAPWLVEKLARHREACEDLLRSADNGGPTEPAHNFYEEDEELRRKEPEAVPENAACIRELANELLIDARDVRAHFEDKRRLMNPRVTAAFAARSRSSARSANCA